MALPPVIPPITPPTTIPGTTAPSSPDALGGCITFLAELLVVGAVAELLYNVSPRAAYLFVLLVVMGYAASDSARLDNVIAFFNKTSGGQT